MQTNRDHIIQLLTAYLQDALSAEQEAELHRWLDQDRRHLEILRQFRQTKEIESQLSALSAVDADAAWKRLQARYRAEYAPGDTHITILRNKGLYRAAAAVLLLLAVVWAGLLMWEEEGEQVASVGGESRTDLLPASSGAELILADGSRIDLDSGTVMLERNDMQLYHDGEEARYVSGSHAGMGMESSDQRNTLMVPKASFFRIVLEDGTRVWVNALSSLQFPVAFQKAERRVFVEGEAYFEVAHDSDRPFLVEAAEGRTVRVLGTRFNVNTRHHRMVTTLIEGKVAVSVGDQVKMLSPGEQAYANQHQFRVMQADTRRVMAWKEGEFYFKDDNIVQIAQQLALWYDLDVRLAGNVSRATEYTGTISRHVKLRDVMNLLTHATRLSFQLEGNRLTISQTKTTRI